MIFFPNAKINLGLNIISRREDGYHNIESCFLPVPWTDILEVLPHESLQFEASGLAIPGKPENNLCLKAFEVLKRKYDIPYVHIYLHKLLPMGAGLGGGSADGAFTLKALNDIFKLGLSISSLQGYANQLGSDCPFFIDNKPVFVEGTGNQFSPIELSLAGKSLLIVKPDVHVPTAVAYAGIKPQSPKVGIRKIIEGLPLSQWKGALKNDFEESIFQKQPEIAKIKSQLYDIGAIYASMSGSGAAVYGIFDKTIENHKALFPNSITWTGKF